jgi:hypothetical protein
MRRLIMAKTVRSRKQKGSKFQKEVAEIIRNKYNLEERDVVSTPSSVFGEDILLSNTALELFPYGVEVKCQEKISIWESLKQAETNAQKMKEKYKKDITPLLVFKRNRSKTYVCLEFDDFLKLI